jgi:MraZ protein
MGVLMGKAQATLDTKGRISLPAKFRRLLPEEVVVTRSPNQEYPSLVLYTEEGFERWIQQVMESKGGYRANIQSFDDVMEEYYENAEYIKLDGAGRLLIPNEQREYAHLDKEVIITGVNNHLILRSATIWQDNAKRRGQVPVYDATSLSEVMPVTLSPATRDEQAVQAAQPAQPAQPAQTLEAQPAQPAQTQEAQASDTQAQSQAATTDDAPREVQL